MKSDHLKHHPALIPLLADLCGTEWAHLYADWGARAAEQEFAGQHTDGTLPLTLVATDDGILLGAVSLIHDDLPGHEHLNPWLASLFVLPGHRGKGVGSFLIREAESFLAKNHIPTAYLFTESAQGLFAREGWSPVGEAGCNGHPVTIFKKDFS